MLLIEAACSAAEDSVVSMKSFVARSRNLEQALSDPSSTFLKSNRTEEVVSSHSKSFRVDFRVS